MGGISHKRKRRIATLFDAVVTALAIGIVLAVIAEPGRLGFATLTAMMLASVLLAVLINLGFRVYRGIIRHLDFSIVGLILVSTALTAALVSLGFRFIPGAGDINLLFLISLWAILATGTVGWRLALFFAQGQNKTLKPRRSSVGIYGSGQPSRALIKSLKLSDRYFPAFIFDENPEIIGGNIEGLRVYSADRLEWALGRFEVSTMIFNAEEAKTDAQRNLIRTLISKGITVRIQPGFDEVLRYGNEQNNLRNIDIADLIGRDQRPSDEGLLRRAIEGRNILVTGAAGSIGSELCRAILLRNPKTLFMMDNSETMLKEAWQPLASIATGRVEMVLGSTLSKPVRQIRFQQQGLIACFIVQPTSMLIWGRKTLWRWSQTTWSAP